MKHSSARILTTHVGSLPRPKKVTELIFAKEREEAYDSAEFDETIASAVGDAVEKQAEAGIDVVSDGEMSKISYATYIKERISGFEGDAPTSPPKTCRTTPRFSRNARTRAALHPSKGQNVRAKYEWSIWRHCRRISRISMPHWRTPVSRKHS